MLREQIRPHVACILFLVHAPLYLQAQEARVSASATSRVEIFSLATTQDLVAHETKLEAVEFQGRKAVRLMKSKESDGLAMLRSAPFADGTIEADIAVKMATPAGVRTPGFIGIAFRTHPDTLHYDMFYLRPGNSQADDQAMRNHSVQYVAPPDFDWYRLRRQWPWVYESHAELQPDTWNRIRIEVQGRRASLYINGGSKPTLVVNGLKGEELKGAVGLWGSPDQESYFSNVRITHAAPQRIENGGEAAGAWDVKFSSDGGQFSGVMNLHRDGAAVSGTVSGLLGEDVPVAGTWRSGYLEVTFRGTWSNRDPGETTARLAGWIDGNSINGRMAISARADGVWTATRRN